MQNKDERLKRQIEFLLETDKMKTIGRQTYIANATRKENDAEHSWSLALMCMLFSEYANEKIDVGHTMEMVLVHDLVEIDAGDTYAYDSDGNQTKRERELAAADRIFHILPDEQAEHIQPLLLNHTTGGISWKEHDVRAEQVISRNAKTPEGSKVLWDYCMDLIKENVEKGNLK